MEIYLIGGLVVVAGYAYMLRKRVIAHKQTINNLLDKTRTLEATLLDFKEKLSANEAALNSYIQSFSKKVSVDTSQTGEQLIDETNEVLSNFDDLDGVAVLSDN